MATLCLFGAPERPGLQVICEVSDGLDAVHKAQELRPDLILLDIGLPTLNGMEAARQVRKLDTKPKIILLTQESSPDIVQEALSLGAESYVVKACAATELLTAVEAVLRGGKFVSSGVTGHDLSVLGNQEARLTGMRKTTARLCRRVLTELSE